MTNKQAFEKLCEEIKKMQAQYDKSYCDKKQRNAMVTGASIVLDDLLYKSNCIKKQLKEVKK